MAEEKRVQVVIQDANRYIPFLNTMSPVNSPIWITENEFNQLKILGFKVLEVAGLPKEKVSQPENVDIDKNQNEQIHNSVEDNALGQEGEQVVETTEPVGTETTVDEETAETPVEVATEQEVTEEEAVEVEEEETTEEVESEEEFLTPEYVEGIKTIQEAKDILDNLNVEYAEGSKLKALKELILKNI